ncbi:Choline-sulfatase [Tritonibacter multivorans]|uniref:Choline-sulfatase n=1 Tax=Tritonibacter multivorans TaxID=928856 RepID=A0A0P1FZT6_9RHOB|nr:sulfatase-like hydrolase/transferase [Tritonibacter multivorans]MDA7422916.1 sulfatase-like hydrolase/transferase [Tritonibacter multivorans]CUH74687.1 Choline-sulfatase [Tritonibacter multivorans]SFD75936.1 choline-sulfatase [Tritonibacter multivorans]
MTQNNLLVIVSDEHQARAMGCAGHPFVKTPHLDQLAAKGTLFEHAYTPCPICVPARAAFATGKYVHETRLWDNAMPYTGAIRGWGHALQEQGVPVESIGKLHYRDEKDPAGFDVEYIPMMVQGGVGMVWAAIRNEEDRIEPGARMLGDYIGPGTSTYTDYDQGVTDRTVAWLEQRSQSEDARPWCLYVGLVAPHFPLVAPQEYYDLYPESSMPDVKLHPDAGYQRHPWVEKQNSGSGDAEMKFTDAAERARAFSAYYGLTSWLDHNVGRILKALESQGFGSTTNVVYSSDHGDNLGARGLWGKSTLYEESVAIPMIMAGPDVPTGRCETPVSLLDVSQTIADQFGATIDSAEGVRSLIDIAKDAPDPERPILSEYHAIGAVSGAFMLRKGPWKLNYYVGFHPELFNLETDPEELEDKSQDPAFADILAQMTAALKDIVDPEQANAQAFADQAALVERVGGKEAALKLGPKSATPPPDVA